LILTTGTIAKNVLKACEQLRVGFTGGFELFSVPQISPLGLEGLKWSKFRSVMTVEEHVLSGGFGSAVLEFLSDRGIMLPLERLGIESPENLPVGSPDYLKAKAGLDESSIAERIRKHLQTRLK
jgi:1-deoxy-D-xylulose-5-phosphate synthase